MNRFLRFSVVVLVCVVAVSSRLQGSPSVFINEIHYDNDGPDVGEFIEIAGPAGTDLSTYSIVLYDGATGSAYNTTLLSGTIPDQDDGFGTVSVAYPADGIQNGPDGVALVQGGTTVIQFLSYEGTFAATDGPASGLTSTFINASESGFDFAGSSLQLVDTGTTYGDFVWIGPESQSPGQVNGFQDFLDPFGPMLSIDDVTVTEGNSGTVEAVFTVSVTGNHTGVSFDITTIEGTASSDNDFVPNALSGLLIPEGSSTYTFTVLVNGDVVVESNEQFAVEVSNVSGAYPVDSGGSGTIVDDDTPPVESADLEVTIAPDAGTVSAGGTVTYTVTVRNLGASVAQNVTVYANGGTTNFPSLAVGASESFSFGAGVDCAAPNGSVIVRGASVTSDATDPVPGNNTATSSVTVANTAPTITGVSASTTSLWPADKKMVDVTINYTASDGCGPVDTVLTVTSNQPVTGPGDKTTPDWVVVNNHLVRLRAERAPGSASRIYTIAINATDVANQTTQAPVTVTVAQSGKNTGKK